MSTIGATRCAANVEGVAQQHTAGRNRLWRPGLTVTVDGRTRLIMIPVGRYAKNAVLAADNSTQSRAVVVES